MFNREQVSFPANLFALQRSFLAILVGFLVWIGEPGAGFRKQLGFAVLAFLILFFGVAYALKKEFWKDVPKN